MADNFDDIIRKAEESLTIGTNGKEFTGKVLKCDDDHFHFGLISTGKSAASRLMIIRFESVNYVTDPE